MKILLKPKNKTCSAGDVLLEHGFKCLSDWSNDNIYESRKGKKYRISHPVWGGLHQSCVRMEII